jgi:hypothetical protein
VLVNSFENSYLDGDNDGIQKTVYEKTPELAIQKPDRSETPPAIALIVVLSYGLNFCIMSHQAKMLLRPSTYNCL